MTSSGPTDSSPMSRYAGTRAAEAFSAQNRLLAQAMAPALESFNERNRALVKSISPALESFTAQNRLLAQAMAPALESFNERNQVIVESVLRSAGLIEVEKLRDAFTALQTEIATEDDEASTASSFATFSYLLAQLPAKQRRDLRDALVGLAAVTFAYAWALCVAGRVAGLVALASALYGLLRLYSAVVTAIEILDDLDD